MRVLGLLLLLYGPSSPTTIEGDIMMDPGLEDQDSLMQFAALANPDRLWPGGRVYYIFDEAFSTTNRETVKSAMAYMSGKNPCIIFEDISVTGNERTDYVKIYNGVGCSSQLGRVGGEQKLSLNTGCLRDREHPQLDIISPIRDIKSPVVDDIPN